MFKKILAASVVFCVSLLISATTVYDDVGAASCPDVKIIFARGSGEERWEDQNYQTFKRVLEEKLKLTKIAYEFDDLDYPAISVANPLTLLATFVSGGEAYAFGESIAKGIENLTMEVENGSCPATKYVLAGYSQGAMLISKAVQKLAADKIIYAATFGDPKLYLPEGAGAMPAACSGKNLSNYRIYVPDCRAHSGMLGGYNPYQLESYIDKLGTWCNKSDFFCSSHLNMRDHTSYVADDIYADASKTIFDKITKALGVSNNFVSLHDTAILIDSTGSMSSLIDKYKTEAMNLARETLTSGGRVALYDFRDVADEYEPHEHCNFETCTLETFEQGLKAIKTHGGGDAPESVLSAGFKVMQKLNWKYGSTKSVVVLTDSTYHNPDLDGTTFADVVNLSKKIDPVNFYIITPERNLEAYQSLATATGGMVTTAALYPLIALRETIMTRYDSLPRVEDFDVDTRALPEVTGASFEKLSDTEVKVKFRSTGGRAMAALNDAVLGVAEDGEFTLSELDFSVENILTLTPLADDTRGEAYALNLNGEPPAWEDDATGQGSVEMVSTSGAKVRVPKAPNTGRGK